MIDRLSEEYSAPRFEPHVTLLGGLSGPEKELCSRAGRLAGLLRPYEVRLGPVEYLDEFYRSLFIHVQETVPVMDANRRAREVFHRLGGPGYMPHLSLLYAHLPASQKEEIISRIGKRFDQTFQATRLVLCSTTGETSSWYKLGEFPFTGHAGF